MEIIFTKTGKYAIDPIYGPVISCYMKKIEELPDEYALKLIKDKWAVECPEEDPGPEGVDELIEEVEDDVEEEIVEAEEEEEEDIFRDKDIFMDEEEEDILSDEEVEIEVDGFEESE